MTFANETLIATPQGDVQIERLAKGDPVLFGSAAGSGLPHTTWAPLPVEASEGTGSGSAFQAIYIQFGAAKRLICTFDQVLLRDDGKLARASELTPGGWLVDRQGQRMSIQEVRAGIWFPTRIEAVNADRVLAGVTAYHDIKVNTGLPESLFSI